MFTGPTSLSGSKAGGAATTSVAPTEYLQEGGFGERVPEGVWGKALGLGLPRVFPRQASEPQFASPLPDSTQEECFPFWSCTWAKTVRQ